MVGGLLAPSVARRLLTGVRQPALHAIDELLTRLSAPGSPRPLGRCTFCGASVFADQPHLRHRGEIFHADVCADYCPPAGGYPPTARAKPD